MNGQRDPYDLYLDRIPAINEHGFLVVATFEMLRLKVFGNLILKVEQFHRNQPFGRLVTINTDGGEVG